MEPHIIDYYNEMPHMVNVIDKMNEELDDAQARIKQLEEENKLLDRFRMPQFKVDTIEEYKQFEKNIEAFVVRCKEVLKDETNGLKVVLTSNDDLCVNLYESYKYNLDHIHRWRDKKAFADFLIDELDTLTQHKNIEWCKYRIDESLKNTLNKLDHLLYIDEDLIDLIVDDHIISCYFETPIITLPCNYIPPGGECWNCLWGCIYYNCEKCDEVGYYNDSETKLLCIDCYKNN